MKIADRLIRLEEASVKEQVKKRYKVDDSAFEKADPNHSVCSIVRTKDGYAGYSHRAAHEFKIGDALFDSEFGEELPEEELDKMPFKKRGFKKCVKIEDCKQAAINFAEYVS